MQSYEWTAKFFRNIPQQICNIFNAKLKTKCPSKLVALIYCFIVLYSNLSQGATGAHGFRGAEGVGGIDGIDGVHGLEGCNGTDGTDGLKGERGAAGPSVS